MEIRQNLGTVPSRPIAVALAVLAVLALALTSWFVFSARPQSGTSHFVPASRPNQLPLNCTNDPYSPHDPSCTSYSDPYSPHDPIS